MTAFPLLDLPLLPLLDITQAMDFCSLFSLSQLSYRTHRLTSLVKKELKSMTWTMSTTNASIRLIVPGSVMVFNFPSTASDGDEDEMQGEKIIFKNYEFKRRGNIWTYLANPWYAATEATEAFYKLSENIMDFSKCQQFNADFNCEFTAEMPLWSLRKEFTRISVNTRTPLTPNTMDFLLTQLTVKDMQFIAGVPDNFMYRGPLNMKTLKIHSPDWISYVAFVYMHCENLEILGSSLPSHVINTIAKKWFIGEMPTLKTIKMRSAYTDRLETLVHCLRGFKIAPCVRPQSKTIGRKEFNMSEGVDFQRRGGKIGTVDVLVSNVFMLVLW